MLDKANSSDLNFSERLAKTGNNLKNLIKLDNFDIRLIAELESDSRQTLSQIAKKLHTSQQVVSYRMQSLQKRNIIGEFYTIIDFAKLGYTNYRTLIRLTNISGESFKDIMSYLVKHPNVLWIVECGGKWDLIVNFLAKNIIHYNFMLSELKSKFPKQIQNYDVLTTVELVYFGRSYFNKNKTRQIPRIGKNLETVKLDKKDLQILKLISENARMNSAEIAEKIKVSANTVISKIKNMKKTDVIQGFKPLIHLENTPYSSYKALIKFQNITEQKEKEIIDYLASDLNVVGIIKQVGLWDFEIEFEVNSKEEMLEFTRRIRDKFKEVIKEFEILPLFHEYKYNFFPGDLLN